MAKESVLATRASLVGVEQQVLLGTVQAYVNVRLAQEIVELRRNNVRVIGEELKASEDRFEVGEVTRTDVALAESALGEARAAMAAAEGDLLVAREAYRALTGAYPVKLAPLPAAPRLPGSLKEAVTIAMRNHPSMIEAQHSVKVADLNVELAKANMKPSIGLSTSVGVAATNQSRDYDYAQAGVSMSQTLYAGWAAVVAAAPGTGPARGAAVGPAEHHGHGGAERFQRLVFGGCAGRADRGQQPSDRGGAGGV